MKITIVPEDKVIIKNGEAYVCDFSMHENIHAVQWYGNFGYVEYKDKTPQLKIEYIQDIPNYNEVLTAFKDAKKIQLPSIYHTWNDDTESFEITPENQDLLDAEIAYNEAVILENSIERAQNVLLNMTYADINTHIDNKVPAAGATLEINKIFKHLARAVKSLS